MMPSSSLRAALLTKAPDDVVDFDSGNGGEFFQNHWRLDGGEPPVCLRVLPFLRWAHLFYEHPGEHG